MESGTYDLVVVISANVLNLLMAVLFMARAAGRARLESGLGLAVVGLAIPICWAVAVNASRGREWWTIFLPLPMMLFCVLELLLDYILHLPFRTTWILWPYLGIYFLGLLALIGYAFGAGKVFGFITLATYFVSLGATWYAHSGG